MMIINCAATEAACDIYCSGGGGIACRSVSATRPTHRTMVHRFDIRRVYTYDNGGPRVPSTAPDSVGRRVYIIITIIWSFILFFSSLNPSATAVHLLLLLLLTFYIISTTTKTTTTTGVRENMWQWSLLTVAPVHRTTRRGPGRTEGGHIIYLRASTAPVFPSFHCRRRRRRSRRYYIILLLYMYYARLSGRGRRGNIVLSLYYCYPFRRGRNLPRAHNITFSELIYMYRVPE